LPAAFFSLPGVVMASEQMTDVAADTHTSSNGSSGGHAPSAAQPSRMLPPLPLPPPLQMLSRLQPALPHLHHPVATLRWIVTPTCL